MTINASVWSWVWIPFFFLFVVRPIIRFGARARGWGWDPRWDWDGHPRRGRQRLARDPDLEAQLEARLAEVDQLQSRLNELENRLDFAERLLAQHRAPQAVGAATPGEGSNAGAGTFTAAAPPSH